MISRSPVAVALAAAIVMSAGASAAMAATSTTTSHKPMAHHTMHTAKPTTGATDADHSADQLNAQSLQRATTSQ